MNGSACIDSCYRGDSPLIGAGRVRIDVISCMNDQLILQSVRVTQNRQNVMRTYLLFGEVGLRCDYDENGSCAAWCVKNIPPISKGGFRKTLTTERPTSVCDFFGI